MTSTLQDLRQGYKSIAKRVQQGQIDNVLYSDVKKYRGIASEEQKRVISNGDYGNLQQNQFYLQKFANFEQLLRSRKNKQISSNDLRARSKVLFDNEKFVSVNSKILSNNEGSNFKPTTSVIQAANSVTYANANTNNFLYPNNQGVIQDTPKFGPDYKSSSVRNVSPQRQALDDFFSKKSQQSQSKLAFNSILQNPSISPRSFKKKSVQNQNQLMSLRNENAQLKRRILSNTGPDIQSQRRLEDSYRNHQLRIRDLQEQNSRLSRDNITLRSERTVTTIVSLNSTNQDDYLYSPYTFSTFNNDIYKINLRNMNNSDDRTERDISEYEPELEQKHNIVYKKVGYEYENYSEQDNRNERVEANYSVFDANRSYYSDSGQIVDGKNQNQQFKTAVRNKMAFFKPKGVIVKNADIEIGYKKTDPEPNNQAVKVILYFNNKAAMPKVIRTNYEYEQDYYEVTVTERIRELQGYRQGRQVVQVRLRGGKTDLNSIIDVNVYVGRDTYKLWLPAMFLKIGKSNGNSSRDQISKSIYPSKPFSKPNEISKVIQSVKINDNSSAQYWVDSVKGSGPVKIQWKDERNKMKIATSSKWLDFVTFLMLDPSS